MISKILYDEENNQLFYCKVQSKKAMRIAQTRKFNSGAMEVRFIAMTKRNCSVKAAFTFI
jgi:hypothetical protein